MSRMLLFSLITIYAMQSYPVSRASAEPPAGMTNWVKEQMPALRETYVWFHTHPELSFMEESTAARIADHFGEDGFDVTTGVGGHGVVGLLKNGDGPTLMLRCDLDALPVTEQTALPYASTAKVTLPDGTTTGVMHACAHDLHMTNLLGTARWLSQHRDRWQGTLMVVAQPAEERGAGARAMLKDGLFERFPKPDYAIALHVDSSKPAGTVGVLPGFALANVDSVDITVKGRGGHGSAPHTAIDPIVQAADLVMSLQTIVSREIRPIDPAVITVGSIHGGTKHNIIGDTCKLQLTVRSYSQEVRQKLLDAIKRKAVAVASSYGAPEPDVSYSEGTPSLKNDAELTARMKGVFESTLGQQQVVVDEPSMGGEDFSQYGLAGVPIVMFRLGTVDPKRLERYRQLEVPPPSLHSSLYYPDFDPSLRTGLLTMTAAALELLGN